MLKDGPLPDFFDRKLLYATLNEKLTKAGYTHNGYESYALPSDPISKAMDEKKAYYGSIGCQKGEATNFVAVGSSAHGCLGDEYYSQNYYEDAIFNLERHIKNYPKDKDLVYAHYLIAICYFEQLYDERKDLKPLVKAREKFIYILNNYPNTDYAVDAKWKMGLIIDQMAAKEMYIGRYYIKIEKWIAAINRFKLVVEEYDTTIYVEEALHRLVEIYYKIGLVEDAQKVAATLGYNYGSGEWYKNSYRIFNKSYKTAKITKREKDSFIRKKFKKLFE